MIRTLFVTAALAILSNAAPAQADTRTSATRAPGSLTLRLDANACDINLTGVECSAYQSRLLAAAVHRSDRTTRAKLNEVGCQQLDALIASIN
ncbi:MAG: hypothetical protein OSB00_15155 [Sphingomonas bacterium]|nr:hypothetical protein [Sphingomonas bacterium]